MKVNCVLLRGFNEGQIEAFAEFSRREGVIVRFIEFMPLEEPGTAADEGVSGGRVSRGRWTPEAVVRMEEIVERLSRWVPGPGVPAGLVELPANAASETARRFTFADGIGRDWNYCAGVAALLRALQPGADYLGRKRADVPVSRNRTTTWWGGCGVGEPMRSFRSYMRRVVMGKEARHHIGDPEFQKPSRNMVHIGG